MNHDTSYLRSNYAREKSIESYRIEEKEKIKQREEKGATAGRGSCSRLSAGKTMTDRIIDWLDSPQFKRGVYLFLAFSAGYFLHSIIRALA